MPLDYTNPHIIKFMQEKFELEKEQRVGWFLANKDKLVECATITESYKGYRIYDVIKAEFNNTMPMLARQHITSRVNRRKKIATDGPVLGLSWIKKDFAVTPPMKPVALSENSILYKELPWGGRRQYLNTRKRKIPEEKYYFCETSSNVIGWQWKDSAFQCRLPKYGRRNNLQREASRSGPQPDPLHYSAPQQFKQ